MKTLALFNIVCLLLLRLVIVEGVEVTQSFPDNMTPGGEYTVTFNVKKGSLQSFAKIQQELPEGFEAVEPLESKGATFSFKDQRVKFIWMNLPPDEEFTITYKLKVKDGITGEFNVPAKFAYIENDERQNYEMPAVTVNVANEPLAANDTGNEGGNEGGDDNSQPENTDTETNTDKGEDKPEKQPEPPKVGADRSIKKISGTEFEVTLKVKKADLEGYGKIEETLPDDFVATEMESASGMFSYSDNVMKVVWMALPKKKTLELKYKMSYLGNMKTEMNVQGKLSYIFNDQTLSAAIDPSTFDVEPSTEMALDGGDETTDTGSEDTDSGDTGSEDTNTGDTGSEDTKTSDTNAGNSTTEDTGSTDTESNDGNNSDTEGITSTPAPEKEVSYKVQICAAHRTVGSTYFRNKYGLQDAFATELHEGWTKYVIGQYKVYKDARDKRNNVWASNSINDAFVTAYNSGQRITVQEALMISKQQWFK